MLSVLTALGVAFLILSVIALVVAVDVRGNMKATQAVVDRKRAAREARSR